MTSYLPYCPRQQMPLPQALQEWLPEGHVAYFISDAVDGLNLGVFHARCRVPTPRRPNAVQVRRDLRQDGLSDRLPGLAACRPFPVAIPTQHCACLDHRAGEIGSARQSAPGSRPVAACRTFRPACQSRSTNHDVPCRDGPSRAAKKIDERVAREKLRFLNVSIDEPTEEQRLYQQSWQG